MIKEIRYEDWLRARVRTLSAITDPTPVDWADFQSLRDAITLSVKYHGTPEYETLLSRLGDVGVRWAEKELNAPQRF